MKKDKIITYMFMMGIIIFCSIIYINGVSPLDEAIYNKKWYSFNVGDGSYLMAEISNDSILLNGFSGFDNCKEYSYNKKDMIFNLDCDKKIEYNRYKDGELVLEINNKEIHFFDTIEQSYNYEFNKYFNMSEGEFIDSYSQVKELILIDYKSLIDFIDEGKSFTLILNGDMCINYECYLFDKLLEKLIVKSSDIYSFNPSNITDDEIKKLNSYSSDLLLDYNFYNSNYPRVVIFSDKNVVETFLIKCDGFDCSKYESIK